MGKYDECFQIQGGLAMKVKPGINGVPRMVLRCCLFTAFVCDGMCSRRFGVRTMIIIWPIPGLFPRVAKLYLRLARIIVDPSDHIRTSSQPYALDWDEISLPSSLSSFVRELLLS